MSDNEVQCEKKKQKININKFLVYFHFIQSIGINQIFFWCFRKNSSRYYGNKFSRYRTHKLINFLFCFENFKSFSKQSRKLKHKTST